jgi:hypothetical protein
MSNEKGVNIMNVSFKGNYLVKFPNEESAEAFKQHVVALPGRLGPTSVHFLTGQDSNDYTFFSTRLAATPGMGKVNTAKIISDSFREEAKVINLSEDEYR